MFTEQKLKSAALLYRYAFPLYRRMYFRFKNKKDKRNLQLIRTVIEPGNIILDIGANIGFYTKFFAECTGGSGQVYAFEPDVTNFTHLKTTLSQNENVTLVQKAVAAESGILMLYLSSLLNVDHRTHEPEQYKGKYPVDKISVDDFVKNKFQVDFIKMDIQGFEMEALKGMEQTITSNPQLKIFTELWHFGLKRAGSSATEMFDFAVQRGFKVFKIGDETITELKREEAASMQDEYFTDTNVLLSRQNIF
ncbi:MAG: FkbM family methyltransferase [Bacteroidetes bacterium]|nr:FkbM family methyltransferase [Bacteroidota bacterium]